VEKERANVAFADEPRTVKTALAGEDAEKWRIALEEEYQSLMDNKTWELTSLPHGRKAVSCKWVFRVKRTATGEVDRYKARLVARGFTQEHGIDYDETFAPVARLASIRVLLAVAAAEDMEVQQMDVKTAYLNGELDEEVYMEQPEGFAVRGSERKVCRLRKALYGLKQAGRAWYQNLDGTLTAAGLVRCEQDQSMYVRQENGEKLLVAVYVDDLVIASSNRKEMADIKMRLTTAYQMTDLGDIHFCLGIRIDRNRQEGWIRLSQEQYVRDILERYNMTGCKKQATPMETGMRLTSGGDQPEGDEAGDMSRVPYASAVGSLMYAMLGTRPDLAFSVSVVSRYTSNPRHEHWAATKRIMRYLAATPTMGLTYRRGGDVVLTGYSDSDWGGDIETRRSTTGYVYMLAGGAVTWGSKRQKTVALSSTEAEYMAATQAAKEAIWLRAMLEQMGYKQEATTAIACDNQGALALTKHQIYHSRTKHIDIQHHYVREVVAAGKVAFDYVATEEMTADVLTKGLSRDKHMRHTGNMGLAAVE